MAIQINSLENEVKFPFSEAYVKINDILLRNSVEEVHININVYASQEARANNGISILKTSIKIKYNEFYTQAGLDVLQTACLSPFSKNGKLTLGYEYLKTNPAYSGMTV